jgi:uridylate kinase
VILARDHHLPIHVFDFEQKGLMRRIIEGEDVGTLITQTPEDIIEG